MRRTCGRGLLLVLLGAVWLAALPASAASPPQTAARVSLPEARTAARAWLLQQQRRPRDTGYGIVPSLVVGIGLAALEPNAAPPGADVRCKPGPQHPYPEVLVNGTFTVMEDAFGGLAPTLANLGYCVFTFNYGAPPGQLLGAIGAVPASAQTLAGFVAHVLAVTGVTKVDLIGWSQGGLLAEYYAKLLGGAPFVHDLVALSPTTHGTTLEGLFLLAETFPGANGLVGSACQACVDQENNSPVIAAVDNGLIAQPGVRYTVIETLDEVVVTPVGSSFINEPGVSNEYVQSFCPFDAVDHVDLTYDRVVFQLIENALAPARARAPNCLFEFPYPA